MCKSFSNYLFMIIANFVNKNRFFFSGRFVENFFCVVKIDFSRNLFFSAAQFL